MFLWVTHMRNVRRGLYLLDMVVLADDLGATGQFVDTHARYGLRDGFHIVQHTHELKDLQIPGLQAGALGADAVVHFAI